MPMAAQPAEGHTMAITKTPAKESTPEYWRRLVRQFVARGSQAQEDRLVALCVEHPDWGIWHAVSHMTGNRCGCARCVP
jgi:hypothetical protein